MACLHEGMIVRVKKILGEGTIPTKNPLDAGWDLYANETKVLKKNTTTKISTDIAIEIPTGYFGLIRDRSSMGVKGINVMAGVIDSAYRGEVVVVLHNNNEDYLVDKGNRIAQLLILPVIDAELVEGELTDSTRGTGGFGSTGK